jgi:hypothetical protein
MAAALFTVPAQSSPMLKIVRQRPSLMQHLRVDE